MQCCRNLLLAQSLGLEDSSLPSSPLGRLLHSNVYLLQYLGPALLQVFGRRSLSPLRRTSVDSEVHHELFRVIEEHPIIAQFLIVDLYLSSLLVNAHGGIYRSVPSQIFQLICIQLS